MRKRLFYLPLIACVILCGACSRKTAILEVPSFHHVNIEGGLANVDVTIHQDTAYYMGITGYETDSIASFVKNDTLFVSLSKCRFGNYKVSISAPEFHSIKAALLHRLQTDKSLKLDSINIQMDLVRRIAMEMNVKRANLDICCCGKATLIGNCDTIYIKSDSFVDAKRLHNNEAHLSCTMNTLKLRGGKALSITDSYLCTIYYDGVPKISTQNFAASSLYFKKYGFWPF